MGFWNFWQHLPSLVRPEIFRIGNFPLRYYSLMYVVAFSLIYFLVRWRLQKKEVDLPLNLVDDFFTWAILGAILGGRLGYVLFYDFPYFSKHPAQIFLPFVWEKGHFIYTGISGMSYHGGLLGLILVTLFFCKKKRVSFLKLSDLFVPAVPLGYTFGRLGNFFNGELYGRPTSVKWGMYFPADPLVLRHPSQLYEALGEGVFLFLLLWWLRKKPFPAGTLLGFYLLGYGGVRFVIEFFREPDPQLGLVWGPFSLGQVFCLGMVGMGLGLSIYLFRRKNV